MYTYSFKRLYLEISRAHPGFLVGGGQQDLVGEPTYIMTNIRFLGVPCFGFDHWILNLPRFFSNSIRYTGAFTLDAIATTGFGLDMDSQEEKHSHFLLMAKKAGNITSLLRPANFISGKHLHRSDSMWGTDYIANPFFLN